LPGPSPPTPGTTFKHLPLVDSAACRRQDMSVAIQLLPETFDASTGSLTGEIWFDVDGQAFPAEHWNDFVVVILGWWLEESALLLSHAGQRSLRFMDGPWRLEIDAANADAWHLGFVDGHGGKSTIVHEATVSGKELVKEVLRAASAAEKKCHELGWSSKDREALRRSHDQLSATLRASVR
jgi:hypothetical protein